MGGLARVWIAFSSSFLLLLSVLCSLYRINLALRSLVGIVCAVRVPSSPTNSLLLFRPCLSVAGAWAWAWAWAGVGVGAV